jgi:DNA polymerase III subunit beta
MDSELNIAFNSRYFVDVLTAIDGNEITIEFSNEIGGIAITDSSDSSFIYIIMPIQD